MNISGRLFILLILPPFLWAANSVFARIAIDSIGPLWLNALRWGLALLILLPLGWRVLSTSAARAQFRQRWVYIGILGLIGVGAYNGLQYVALRTSTPVNVTLIASSLPLWSMIVGALFYRVHPTRPQLVGAVLSLAGVLTVLARGDPLALLRIQLVEGDLLMVLAIIGWAIYSWMLVRPPAHDWARRWQARSRRAGPGNSSLPSSSSPSARRSSRTAPGGWRWPKPAPPSPRCSTTSRR